MKKLVFLVLLALLSAGTSVRAASITDDMGATHVFNKPFTRIISLYGAHTENLFHLGLDAEIIGVSKNEDYPSLALSRTQFSARDGVEKFLAAHPDLVLIRPMHARAYQGLWNSLRKRGVTVVALQPSSINEMYAYWRKLGQLTGTEPMAERMIGDFKQGLEVAAQHLKRIGHNARPGVFFESIHKKIATFSPGSMPLLVVEMAGGRNVATNAHPRHGTNIAEYGLERMLAKADKIDVYLAQYGAMNHISVKDIMTSPAASRIKAVRDRNVFLVDEHLVSRPTMRLLRGIEVVHQLLHPQGNH